MPLFGLVRMWVWGLAAVALWVGVGLLVWRWADSLPDPRPAPPGTAPADPPPPPSVNERLAAWRPGADAPTALLAGAVALTLLGVGGGRGLFRLLLPKRGHTPRHERWGEFLRIPRPDGAELHIEVSGPAAGPLVVLTHGWGATATEWGYLRRRLEDRYRVAAYDLRGLGRSKGPTDKAFDLNRMADDLRAVVAAAGGGPAVLVGHSIGGMIQLNLAKQHPEDLGTRVAGMVVANSTPTNPTHTTRLGEALAALQKPVLEPLARVMIVLAPLVWAMNVLSYLNGSAHWSNYRAAFSLAGTWGQVEFATRWALGLWPATYARGALGMFCYHAGDALAGVRVPVLVVAGDRDVMTVPGASEAIRAGVPRAEMLTLSPAGHMGPVQRPDDFAVAVRGFLDRHHHGG